MTSEVQKVDQNVIHKDLDDSATNDVSPATPLDLVMLPNYSVENAKLIMDILIKKYDYIP